MERPFEFLMGARADFDESFNWYAARSSGAAIGFAAAVDQALEKERDRPWPVSSNTRPLPVLSPCEVSISSRVS